jgi:hypothetical protein
MNSCRICEKADLPFESVILLIGGMTLLIAGALLFPVSSGALAYYENGLYGLLLLVFALQIITMGKTPFGDMRRSRMLTATGLVIAVSGMITCFIPTTPVLISRLLLFLSFSPGGLLLLLQMFLDEKKLRSWVQYRGIFRHLIAACSMVYALSILIGALLWKRNLLPTPLTAMTLLVYGASIIYLAVVLRSIYGTYTQAENVPGGDIRLSTDQVILLLTGIFMVLLGLLLIPVNVGLLPFSGSAQLGLLMVIFAVQMLSSGNSPIGTFPRSWLMIVFGLLFAALGIVSCIIPDILVKPLGILVGVLNILGGVLNLIKILIPLLKRSAGPRKPVPSILVKLIVAQIVMNLLSVMFGTSMLVAHMIPAMMIGVILSFNGCFLLYLLHILLILDQMKKTSRPVSSAFPVDMGGNKF